MSKVLGKRVCENRSRGVSREVGWRLGVDIWARQAGEWAVEWEWIYGLAQGAETTPGGLESWLWTGNEEGGRREARRRRKVGRKVGCRLVGIRRALRVRYG